MHGNKAAVDGLSMRTLLSNHDMLTGIWHDKHVQRMGHVHVLRQFSWQQPMIVFMQKREIAGRETGGDVKQSFQFTHADNTECSHALAASSPTRS